MKNKKKGGGHVNNGFYLINVQSQENELCHHGIKGQKWGVRRFQNPDGTLTSAGKKRYSSAIKKPLDVNNLDRKDVIRLMNSGEDFTIKNGSSFYRATLLDKPDSLDGRRYVSFREDDLGIYDDMIMELSYGPNGFRDVYNKEYEATKNVSVAGGRVQAKILQDIFGKDVKQGFYDRAKTYSGLTEDEAKKLLGPIDKLTSDQIHTYLRLNPFGHDMDILNRPRNDPDAKKYIDALNKMGYDAVVDIVDGPLGYSDGAVVILNGKNVMKEKKSQKWTW